MTAPCRHSVPDPATCSACGLVEMEDFRAPIVPAKHTLTIAEAEALYPGATVTMDWMIPHIVHGEDVQLKCTKNKKLQASCRLYGTHRRSRVQHLLTRLARWSSPPRPDYPNDFVSASLNRAIESTASVASARYASAICASRATRSRRCTRRFVTRTAGSGCASPASPTTAASETATTSRGGASARSRPRA